MKPSPQRERVEAVMLEIAGPLAAVLVALALGAVLLGLLGRDPLAVYGRLFTSLFGSAYGFGQVLFKATTLIGTGLAVAVAFRGGFFNIGVEGQMLLGGLAAATAATALPAAAPAILAIPLVLLAGGLAGAAWAAIPGLLKAYRGVHEVINTIMMNFIAFALCSWLLVEHLAVFETVHTPAIPEAARLARLGDAIPAFRGAAANVALVLQLLLAIAMFVVLWRTRWGFEVRVLGASGRAADVAAIPRRRRMVEVMALSGFLAGLAAANFVQGYKYYYEDGFTAEAGFKGIAVALLARNHPLAIVPAAILFGGLERGGFAINALVPKELVDILQAIALIAVIVLAQRTRRIRMRRTAEMARQEG